MEIKEQNTCQHGELWHDFTFGTAFKPRQFRGITWDNCLRRDHFDKSFRAELCDSKFAWRHKLVFCRYINSMIEINVLDVFCNKSRFVLVVSMYFDMRLEVCKKFLLVHVCEVFLSTGTVQQLDSYIHVFLMWILLCMWKHKITKNCKDNCQTLTTPPPPFPCVCNLVMILYELYVIVSPLKHLQAYSCQY